MKQKKNNILKIDDLDLNEFDFVDFGCSNGGSLDFCALTFGGDGIGIDIDSNKVLTAKKKCNEFYNWKPSSGSRGYNNIKY